MYEQSSTCSDSKHLGRMSKTKRVKGGSFKTGENYLLMLELFPQRKARMKDEIRTRRKEYCRNQRS